MLASSQCTDIPSPSKKSGEETLLPIFSEGGGTSVHRASSNFRAPGERSSASFFQVKMFTGSVRMLLTGVSLRLIEFRQIYCC